MKKYRKVSLSIMLIIGLLLIGLLMIDNIHMPLFAQPKQMVSPQQEKVLNSIKWLILGKENGQGSLSSRLLERVSQGDFKAIYVTDEQIVEASVNRYRPLDSQLELFMIDVVLKRDSGFQWVQFEVLWNPEEEKLIDLNYQPIDYLARLNSQAASTDGLNVAQQILSRLATPDPALMGWRYKKTGSPGQDGISNVQIISLLPFGSYLPQGSKEPAEVAVKAQYQVNVYDRKNLVESILYLKNYNGHWQLEDIRLLDVKRVSSP